MVAVAWPSPGAREEPERLLQGPEQGRAVRACPAEATAACPSLPRAAEAAEETLGVSAGASVHSAGFLDSSYVPGPVWVVVTYAAPRPESPGGTGETR